MPPADCEEGPKNYVMECLNGPYGRAAPPTILTKIDLRGSSDGVRAVADRDCERLPRADETRYLSDV